MLFEIFGVLCRLYFYINIVVIIQYHNIYLVSLLYYCSATVSSCGFLNHIFKGFIDCFGSRSKIDICQPQ